MVRKISPAAFRLCVVAAFLALAASFAARQTASAGGEAMILPTDPAPLVVETAKGERSFTIEVASEPAQRSAGLMFRRAMADDHGMLFVFERTQTVGFWMKNTPMPLDLIFIGEDGHIAAIGRGEPQSEAVISPGAPVRFVLELKAGTAAREGIADGDAVKHPAIAAVSGAE